MYICICNNVKERQVVEEVKKGAHSMKELKQRIKICDQCKICVKEVCKIIKETKSSSNSK